MSKVLLAVVLAGLGSIVACSDFGGTKEGDSCNGSHDPCASNLTCTPVEGRNGSFCCPTPATASNYQNCHPVATK